MKTKVYRKVDQKLLDKWQALWEKSEYANYTNGPQWFVSVMESFSYSKYVVIATYRKKRLVAIGALVEDTRYGLNVLATAPSDFVCGFPFLIDLKNRNVMQSFVRSLAKLDAVVLDNVPREYSSLLRYIEQKTSTVPFSVNYRLSFDHNLNSYFNKHRTNLVRAVREHKEKFTFKVFSGINPKALQIAFEIDNSSRKMDRGYGTFSDENIKTFYETLAKNFKKHLKIHVLYFEDTPIAYEMGFLVKNTYYGSQIAFSSKYYSYTPGKILAVYLVESLFKKKITTLDFGSGDNHLKRAITDSYRDLDKIIISNNRFIRMYISSAYKYKDKIFSYLYKNKKAYYLYRKARKAFGV